MRQSPESINIWLPDAVSTKNAGRSLCKALYTSPLDVLLSGELGAGKTTFLQGFAEGLGITQAVTSPTFALEQRYDTSHGECIHVDLYRLAPKQAQELLRGTDTRTGIRCIEWPEHAERTWTDPHIHIHLHEERGGRLLSLTFEDASFPTIDEITAWRKEMMLPEHVARHCDAVAAFATTLSDLLLKRGTIVRRELINRAGRVHDLMRFLDFRPEGNPDHRPSAAEVARWEAVRREYPNLRHEPACAAFLRKKGFEALAEVVAVHGLMLPAPERTTIEQKLLYYADKRVRIDEVVTLDERFADFQERYGQGEQSEEGKIWYAEAKATEKELFPEGVPV